MKVLAAIISLVVVLVATCASAQETHFSIAEYAPYCGHVWLQRAFKLRLGEMEKRLTCGDPQTDAIGIPWTDVPANQARYFLRSFLQSRGFHNPDFTILNGLLFVRPGPLTRLTDFLIFDAPPFWRPPRKRMIVGLPLTPTLLDELQGWTESEVRNAGYACAVGDVRADPDTGLVRIDLQSGERLKILDVLDERDYDERDYGLDSGALDRYNAFLFDDMYSERLVRLTRKRLLDAGLLQTVSFRHECFPNGVLIHRNALLGPRREMRVGFGGNTEEGVRVRAMARVLRVGRMASSAEARLNASLRRQEARLAFRWFYTPRNPRHFIEPVARFNRQDEPQIAVRTLDASVLHGWNQEYADGQIELRLGPMWQMTRLERGQGPAESTLVFAKSDVSWVTHDAEFFATSPRQGARFDFEMLNVNRAWGAGLDATRVAFSGLYLFNSFRFDPPLLILGARYRLGTTLAERDVRAEQLPLPLRFYAGGTDDLRGFSRQSLPHDGRGSLSEATIGLEARMYRVIWRRVDPFIFTDVGRLGEQSLSLEATTYISPGFGLRWESPIGAFRGFLAWGHVSRPPADFVKGARPWRWGLSFVDEF